MVVLYEIYCHNNVYVGITSNLKQRKNRHLRELRQQIHHNCRLQRCYDKYGESELHFQITGIFQTRYEASCAEMFVIEHCDTINVAKGGIGGDTISNHPNKRDIVQRILSSRKLKGVNFSEEFKKQQTTPLPSEVHGEFLCKRCGRSIKGKSNYLRYHGDNCGKTRKDLTQCPYCKKIGAKTGMVRWHFENCKLKELK